ncbi:MAG: class I SAM-dependent methyltransferase, partial [Bacteroidia bacterium]
CDLYELPEHLKGQFDIVYSSYGTIGWLPDLDKWAAVVNAFLKPGGRLILIEFHPVVWMFDEQLKTIAYNYFNTEDIVEETSGTYADPSAPVKSKTISWNHPLAEVLGAVLSQGLAIKDFREYDYSPYNCFKNMKRLGRDQFVIEHLGRKIPMLYALDAIKQ